MKTCKDNCQCQIFHQDTLNEVKRFFYTDDTFYKISHLFKVLNDPSRLKILEAIKDHALCVCDLASLLGVSKSAISHQMSFLRKHALVIGHKKGKMVYYELLNEELKPLINQAYQLVEGIKQ